jgi:hypothetical protein
MGGHPARKDDDETVKFGYKLLMVRISDNFEQICWWCREWSVFVDFHGDFIGVKGVSKDAEDEQGEGAEERPDFVASGKFGESDAFGCEVEYN